MIPEAEQRRLDRITSGSIGSALEGFPLEPQCSLDWLAKAICEALRISMIMSRDVSWRTSPVLSLRGPRGGPDRQSTAKTKREIVDLAGLSAILARRLNGRSKEAGFVLWMHAFWSNPHEKREQPSDHERFLEIIRQLDWMTEFMTEAAEGLPKQSPRWAETERREQRIFHAQNLSTVFEWAFGKPATVITWQDRLEGPWPDFFQRIMGLVFDEPKTPSLEAVLDEARRRYKSSGGLFDPEKLNE